MMKNSKKGFNLIEIAIVLAVVGLVIGGIYVAASSVTDNQRKQKAQSQLLQIVQNFRVLYSSQADPAAGAVTGDVLANARVMPADMPRIGTGNTFSGAYGAVAMATLAGSQFTVTLNGVTQSACVDFASKNFGTAQARNQIGLVSVLGGVAGADALDGTVADAVADCDPTNIMIFTFALRA